METPFDRGEVDRASMEATERLRQRLAKERVRERDGGGAGYGVGRKLLPWVAAGGFALFSAGMIASPWFETIVRDRLPFGEAAPADAAALTALTTLTAVQARLAALEAPDTNADAPPAERLARTEARVETSTDLLAREADRIDKLNADVAALTALLDADRARIETATRIVTGASERSEAMLAVILARRAIEDGRTLGAIEAPLRRAFDDRYAAAVRAVTTLGAAPVSAARLRRELAALGPLEGERPGSGQSWWDVFSARVSRLVRPVDGVPGPEPRSAADAALSRGDVTAAAAQLRRLPTPRPAAVDRWLEAADRFSAGEEALRQLETAALIPPPAVVAPETETAKLPKPATSSAGQVRPRGRPTV